MKEGHPSVDRACDVILDVWASDRLLRGVELAARDYGGDGPDVILLHGATRNLEDWRMVLDHLTGVRVVSVDQRFHGNSGVPASASPSDPVRDVEAMTDALSLTNPHVVGHSLGEMNALLYGAEHPECPGVLNIDGYDFRQRELAPEEQRNRIRR